MYSPNYVANKSAFINLFKQLGDRLLEAGAYNTKHTN